MVSDSLRYRKLKDAIDEIDSIETLDDDEPIEEDTSVKFILDFCCHSSVSGLHHSATELNGYPVVALTGEPFFDEPVPLSDARQTYIIGPEEMPAINGWFEVKTPYLLLPSSSYLFDALKAVLEDVTGSIAIIVRDASELMNSERQIGIDHLDIPAKHMWSLDMNSFLFGNYYLGSTIYFESEEDAVAFRIRADQGHE